MPEALHAFFERSDATVQADPQFTVFHAALLDALESGQVRAASRNVAGDWVAHAWVKRAILAGFRNSTVVATPGPGFPFFDKSAYPARAFTLNDQVRLVPGGSAVRRGAHIGKGVVLMPPAYVNVGAWVGEGSMVDSHALVGSCAQVGARVHLSAGAQIGGVLEPAGARPVVVEDGAFIGALAGVLEGVVVRERAVLAAGVILTAASVIHDLVHGRSLRGEVPAGAVVVPGMQQAQGDYAMAQGLSKSIALIVKYRDARTDAATALEDALR
ncbi:MAG: 2,3,4,5-tetrahydropyridine-2,6-dicarboxylate N-succinyltransferase [Planctomycetes bacterium]|nr:2,3,4,5-tetrahydropyridine-2,6-dicarboxylate N-succinyltransferase [Planctomycetota bacterium]